MNLTPLVPNRTQMPVAQRPLRQMLDRVFADWFDGGMDIADPDWIGFKPSLDVAETDTKLVVSAELPGMAEDDVEIQLDGDRLLISGEKSEEKEEEKKNFYRRECSYGSFRREVLLPAEVVADKVKAKFKNGVLTVTLPKTPEARRKHRKIAIESAT